MKAERRHELKENSLVRGARNFPEMWRQYGSKVTLGVILVALVVVLVMRWRQSREENRRVIAQDLTQARSDLSWLQQNAVNPYAAITARGMNGLAFANQIEEFIQQQAQMAQVYAMMRRPMPSLGDVERSLGNLGGGGESALQARQTVWSNVDKAVTKVLAESSDPAEVAEAKLLRADTNLYWAFLASLGDVPEATTRPDLKIAGRRDEYLKAAEANYQDVANQAGALSAMQSGSAGLGLGAVAEMRGKPADATRIYGELEQKNGEKLVKDLAAERKARLAAFGKAGATVVGPARDKAAEDAAREKWLAQTRPSKAPTAVPAPTSGPATQPASTTQPTTASQPAPATLPSASTTRPGTTQPAVPATEPAAPATQPAATTRPATGQG